MDVYEPQLVRRGYWFVAPYSSLKERDPSTLYQPLQTGPHIYDQQGELIWSGAHLVSGDRATFDFRVSIVNGTQQLSLLLLPNKHAGYNPGGAGLLLDATLNISHQVHSAVGNGIENMHEFNVVENGRRALMITYQSYYRQFSASKGYTSSGPLRSIGNPGFAEVDIATGSVIFEWWAIDHISPTESVNELPTKTETSWDWYVLHDVNHLSEIADANSHYCCRLHLNSVDKDDKGDYLVSARYTNTIYKISGSDGSVLWRLGGLNSSFTLERFNFTGQHDARFRQNDTISFLDNATSDVGKKTATHSTGIIVSVNTVTMTATLVQAFPRPDGRLSELRGNLQMLEDGVLINWSDNGFMSEYTADGRHVLDVKFASHRFTTYRGFRFNVTLTPKDSPVMRAFVYGHTPNTSISVFYVSWNGATEVTGWRFFATRDPSSPCVILGEVPRAGFETQYATFGLYTTGFVRAIAADGSVLGESRMENLTLPTGWLLSGSSDSRVQHSESVPIPSSITKGWPEPIPIAALYHTSLWTTAIAWLLVLMVCGACVAFVRPNICRSIFRMLGWRAGFRNAR